jgi:hypothetical protein
MDTPWIRIKDIPEYFHICRTHAYELAKEFKAQANKADWIQDGRVTLIRISSFEEWWRGRNDQ